MTNDFAQSAEKNMAALESTLAPLFEKLPHLPTKAREVITQIAPWLALIFGVLGLFALLSMGMFGFFFAFSFLSGGLMPIAMLISFLTGLAGAILNLLAYKPLSAHKKQGWNYIFYATVLSVVAGIVNFAIGYGDAAGSIVGGLIGFWLLFEVRGLYR